MISPRGLADALARWADRAGLSGAAVYCGADASPCLVERWGEGSFPPCLAPEGSLPGAGRLALQGGVLLFEPQAAMVATDDPLLELLASQLQVYELDERLKQQRFQAQYHGVEVEALYDVGLAILGTLDLTRLSEEILLRAVSLLDARRGAFYDSEDGVYHLRSSIGGDAPARLEASHPELAASLAGQGSTAGRLLTGSHFEVAAAIDSEGQPRGLLLVADKESRRGVGPFSDLDQRTLALFAHLAAIALENARLHREALEMERFEREMELAAEIQQQILPTSLPHLAGYEVWAWNRPARHVGGDHFDVFACRNGNLMLAVADATGKGVPAALMVSALHSALRMSLDRVVVGPDLLGRLNRHVLELSLANKFITLLLAELEAGTGRLRYLNAGHNPGILLRFSQDGAGDVERLAASGPPLGLLPDATYEVREIGLEPGDLLCFYSDGITECASLADEEFGEGRLIAALSELAGLPLAEIVAGIAARCDELASGRAQGDDQTLVLLRRLPGAAMASPGAVTPPKMPSPSARLTRSRPTASTLASRSSSPVLQA